MSSKDVVDGFERLEEINVSRGASQGLSVSQQQHVMETSSASLSPSAGNRNEGKQQASDPSSAFDQPPVAKVPKKGILKSKDTSRYGYCNSQNF